MNRRSRSGARSASAAIRLRREQAGRMDEMAKGQLRGNREAKKPKKEKPKAVAAPSDLTARLQADQAKNKGGKR
jgi:hypothetical protein